MYEYCIVTISSFFFLTIQEKLKAKSINTNTNIQTHPRNNTNLDYFLRSTILRFSVRGVVGCIVAFIRASLDGFGRIKSYGVHLYRLYPSLALHSWCPIS